MSVATLYSLSAFDPRHYVARAKPEHLHALGVNPAATIVTSSLPGRSVSVLSSDPGALAEDMNRLFDAYGTESWVRHLSDQKFGIEYYEGDEHWQEVVHYSLLTSPEEMVSLAKELDAIVSWCEDHIQSVSQALDRTVDPEHVRYVLSQLSKRTDLSRDGAVRVPEDTDSRFLLFSFLCTSSSFLQRASKSGQWFAYRAQGHAGFAE